MIQLIRIGMTDSINRSKDGSGLSPRSRDQQGNPADHGQRIFTGLLTDLDNTLYDFAAAQEAACRAVVRIAGTGDCDGLIRAFLFSPHGVTSTTPIRVYLQDLGIDDEDRIARACTEYETVKKNAIIPFPGVVETLRFIHASGIRIGAVTNASSSHARERLERIGVSDLFSSLVSPDITGLKKPDPAIFRKAADEIGIGVLQICMIGDNLVNDIAPAQLLGIFTVHARYGDHLPPEFAGDAIPDAVLDCFSGLVTILGLKNDG